MDASLRQFYETLIESQWWSSESLEENRRVQLAQLLQHARRNVPFYEHRLDAVMTPRGDIDWARWSEIPIIQRQHMVDHRDMMQAQDSQSEGEIKSQIFSSGSTGVPVSVTIARREAALDNGTRWRCQRWHDLDWSKNLGVWIIEVPQGQALPGGGADFGVWGPVWDERTTGHAWGFDREWRTSTIVRALKDRDCAYLNRGPKAAHALALECERLGIGLRLDVVLAQGEHVDEDDRAAMARVFGARVIETYSCKEAGQVAHPCPLGTLHVNEEAVFVEVLDSQGQPCAMHEAGRVVVTPLYHAVQPLIRYELGDIAERGAPCPCGRHSMTLKRVLGRTTQMFRHPDGGFMLRLLPAVVGKPMLDCTQWQIAQVGPLDFEVRYIPRSQAEAPEQEAFTSLFRSTFFSEARLTLRRVSEISRTSGGKYLEYVNEYEPANSRSPDALLP